MIMPLKTTREQEPERMYGNDLYREIIGFGYGNPEHARLVLEVWSPTPWVLNVHIGDRRREIEEWCVAKWGRESSPIHNQAGLWHCGGVTVHGWNWIGFKTESIMRQFEEQWPSPARRVGVVVRTCGECRWFELECNETCLEPGHVACAKFDKKLADSLSLAGAGGEA